MKQTNIDKLITWMEDCIKTLKGENIQDDYQKGFIGGYRQCLSKAKQLQQEEPNQWISVEDRLPEVKKNRFGDHSDNVLAWCNNELMVLCLSEAQDEDGNWGIAWCNCYGKIDSEDAEFDDEYYPTHWQPLPKPPINKQP